MTDITKQDLNDLTEAMVGGFEALHQRFEEVDERLTRMEETQTKYSDMIDHIAGRVDGLWVEAGAQTQANRRFETRIDRLEKHLGLSPIVEDLIAA